MNKFTYAPTSVLIEYTSCSANTTKFRLENGKLRAYGSGLIGATTSWQESSATWSGLSTNSTGWPMVGDLSPINPVDNGGVAAASNAGTTLSRGSSVAVPFAMRATANYNKVNSSTITFTAPENT
ncbi:hypothetical protein IAE22_31300, partial [Bacillus sp. S34]|nr:hypothetical protein [Bacillus sp. S34]